MTARYLRISTVPAIAGQRCQGRICRRPLLEVGAPLTLVAHEQRARDTPNAQDARAHLCADCCARLGELLVTPEPVRVRIPLPTHIRGKLIESW